MIAYLQRRKIYEKVRLEKIPSRRNSITIFMTAIKARKDTNSHILLDDCQGGEMKGCVRRNKVIFDNSKANNLLLLNIIAYIVSVMNDYVIRHNINCMICVNTFRIEDCLTNIIKPVIIWSNFNLH